MCEACDLHAKLMALLEKDGHIDAKAPTMKQLTIALNALLRTAAAVAVATGNGDQARVLGTQIRSTLDYGEFIRSGFAAWQEAYGTQSPPSPQEAAQAAFDALMVGSKH